jgi:hypothetical protein
MLLVVVVAVFKRQALVLVVSGRSLDPAAA